MESFHTDAISVGKYIVDAMVEKLNSIAILEFETRKSITYHQLSEKIINVAGNLQMICGLKTGDFVLLLLPNCIEFVIAWYGTVYAGGTIVAISEDSTEDELELATRNMSIACTITSSEHTEKLARLHKRLRESDQKVFFVGNKQTIHSADHQCFQSFCTLLSSCHANVSSQSMLEEPATIAFSSGTTGLPKGVALSHKAVIAAIEIMRNKIYVPPEFGENILCPLSLVYGYPQYAILHLAIKEGATVVLMKKYNPENLLKGIMEFRVKQLHIVPVIGAVLTTLDVMHKYDLTSVKILMNSGSMLPPRLEIKLLLTFPNVTYVRQAYGMTECAPATITAFEKSSIGSVGQQATFMELKIMNLETGVQCDKYKAGEVWIRGPTKMIGYLRNAEATRAIMTQDGWIKTGDVGFIDEHSNLFLVDRIKELIKYKSKQIAPAELENVLLQHPAIMEAAVIGIPKMNAGEVPRAYVHLVPGHSLTSDEVHYFVRGKLAPHKWLRGGVQFVQEIPHSASGKILRNVIKQQAMKEINESSLTTKGL